MTFSFKRYTNLLSYDIFTHKKKYLSLLLSILGIFFFIEICYLFDLYTDLDEVSFVTVLQTSSSYLGHPLNGIFPLFGGVFFFMTLISISKTFDIVNTKLARLNFLLLPANHLEKFLSRLTLTAFIAPLVIILMAFISDFFIGCLLWFCPNLHCFKMPLTAAFLTYLDYKKNISLFDFAGISSMVLFLLTLALLCSALFRKYVFPLMILVWVALIIGIILSKDFLIEHHTQIKISKHLFMGIFYSLSTINILLSYYLFKKTTLLGYTFR